MRATVIGGGVSGLTTAAVLLEHGWHVEVVARERYDQAVSIIAAAVWTMTDAEPVASTRRWAVTSWQRFDRLAGEPGPGVIRLPQREYERHDPNPTWWLDTPYVRRLDRAELPAGYAAGFEIDGFGIEPPRYLAWLTDRVRAMGGRFVHRAVHRLDEVNGEVVVNCTGLGARELAGDDGVFPIRGQVVAVANPGIREGVADESDVDRVTYIYPRSTEVVLGGTRQPDDTEPEPDPETTERILADCADLDPRVANAEVRAVRVGFRPGRASVRVEPATLPDGRTVVHNYGHGGSGYILSWGCAEETAALAAGH